MHRLCPLAPPSATPSATRRATAPRSGDVLSPHAPCARGLEVRRGKVGKLGTLAGREIGVVLGPGIACAFEFGARLDLGAAHLFYGIADELHDMEAVESNLGLGEVFANPFDERRAHIDRGLLDAACIAAVVFEVIGEPGNSIGAATIADEGDAAAIDIDDQGDVVVPAPGGRFVDGNARDTPKVHARHCVLDVVEHNAPKPFVGDLHELAGCNCDRQMHGKCHGGRLEQQRETGAGPRPRHVDLTHAALAAFDARCPRGDKRLILEEVEVAPCFLGGVVHRHAAGAALRAIEARARLEVEMDIEAALIIVEVGRRHEPG